jgi:hypothetical protein
LAGWPENLKSSNINLKEELISMTLYSEITEQPERIKSLLVSQKKNIELIAAKIQKREIQYVFLAARGTSDNAGRYANYLLGGMNGLPLALACAGYFLIRRFFGDLNKNFCQHLPAHKSFPFNGMLRMISFDQMHHSQVSKYNGTSAN